MMTTVQCISTWKFSCGRECNWRNILHKLVELSWFLLALSLFMILGPFAAPFAVVAIMSLKDEERGMMEPESAEEYMSC